MTDEKKPVVAYQLPGLRQTAYENTRRAIARGWEQAKKLDREKGIVQALKDATIGLIESRANGTKTEALPDYVLSALPFVLGDRIVSSLANPWSWPEFATHPDILDFCAFESHIGGMVYNRGLASDFASASTLNIWHYTVHGRAGQRVFELSNGLAERLQHTELRGLSTDDLRLPYPNIYIVVPESLGLTLSNQLTGIHALGGVYVTETFMNDERVWKLLFWGPPNEKSKGAWDDALFHFTVKLPKGISLDEALDQSENHVFTPWSKDLDKGVVETPFGAIASGEASFASTAHSENFYRSFWRPMFKLVLNTVVYSTWPDADTRFVENGRYTKLMEQLKKHPKGSHKRERVLQELKEVPQQRRVLLGGSVRRILDGVPTSETGRILSVRTLVTGHWQRFAFGPGRTERKWGWREPFWRGPESAPESNPRRILDTASGEGK